MKLLIAILALAGSMFAQTVQCPVTITRVFAGSTLNVKYKNTSEKEIQGVKFNATFYDSTNDPHPIGGFQDSGKLKPGKSTLGEWHAGWEKRYGELAGGAEVWVEKVAFNDGTSWQDDGEHTCIGLDNRREKRSIK